MMTTTPISAGQSVLVRLHMMRPSSLQLLTAQCVFSSWRIGFFMQIAHLERTGHYLTAKDNQASDAKYGRISRLTVPTDRAGGGVTS